MIALGTLTSGYAAARKRWSSVPLRMPSPTCWDGRRRYVRRRNGLLRSGELQDRHVVVAKHLPSKGSLTSSSCQTTDKKDRLRNIFCLSSQSKYKRQGFFRNNRRFWPIFVSIIRECFGEQKSFEIFSACHNGVRARQLQRSKVQVVFCSNSAYPGATPGL